MPPRPARAQPPARPPAPPGPPPLTLSAKPPPRDSPPAAVTSGSEYVDIDPLRELVRVGARLEHRDDLQVVGIGLELLLERGTGRMMVMGVVAHHAFDILEARLLRRIGQKRLRRLAWIFGSEHRCIQ